MTTKTASLALFVALFAAAFTANAQNYQLVWADEFTNGISDAWTFEIGTGNNGWGNNELQFYRAENAAVVDGMLEITAKAENFGGMNYTSTRMKTQCGRSFQYGRVEARIKMPSFTGSWPAFWMLGDYFPRVGWPRCGEIDIMEHVNTDPNVHGTIHWFNNGHVFFGGSTPIDVTEFHVYSVEWDETGIRWFVDGNLYHVANTTNGINDTNEFHHSYFLILNMAIGGNWPGFTVDASALPATMYVDYVRVYQADGIVDPIPALNLPCVAD
jgi:beta-glucanase (GH16 family)